MQDVAQRKREVARAVLQGAEVVHEVVNGKPVSIEPRAILTNDTILQNCGDFLLHAKLQYEITVEGDGRRVLKTGSEDGALTPCFIRYLTPEAARAAFITLKIFRGDG
jgi:hypothetical protein